MTHMTPQEFKRIRLTAKGEELSLTQLGYIIKVHPRTIRRFEYDGPDADKRGAAISGPVSVLMRLIEDGVI